MNRLESLSHIGMRVAAVALVAVGASFSQTLPTAKSIAAEMGAGWNLGNSMEAPGSPTAWGNPIPTQALFDSVKAAGFKTVRLPAAWDSHANQTTHVIDGSWMAQVKTVVDYAIKDSLFVILNIHWDGGWVEGKIDSAATRPAMKAAMYTKQGAYWRQIATTFKGYDRHLLFASANEPAVDTQKNLSVLIGLHQIFIDTVRVTGGNNASRTLIIQGPSTSFEHTANWMTGMPNDKINDRLMVEAHFYPYQFCLMSQPADWSGGQGKLSYPFFYWGKQYHSTTDTDHNPTWGEESYVDSQFNLLKPNYLDKNIPVVVGEFGALKRLSATGDNLRLAILSRRHFYNYVVKSAIGKGMIPVAWDAGGLGDGTMSVFRRSKAEGAIYDLGLLNAIRDGAVLAKLPGDTTSDYTLPSGDNSLRILYSAKDSGRGQVSLPIVKANISGYDSIVAKIYVKGTSQYDSAGISKNGFVSLSLVTMSKNWFWREKTLGALTMDGWKNYSIPLSSDSTNLNALVPADPTALQAFALQAYSKAFRGAIYVDWIVFKTKNGTSDTLYNFNQTGPQDGNDNVVSVQLFPTASVPSDLTWQTATTSVWGATSIRAKTIADANALGLFGSTGTIRATFQAAALEPAVATLSDLQGRKIWARSFETVVGTNELEIPALRSGPAILRINLGSRELVGKVFCP